MGPTYFLGVDGGNSKTLALIADDSGRVVASGRGGCSDIYGASSAEAALDTLAHVIQASLDAARLDAADLTSAGLSMAGADWPEDHDFLRDAARAFGLRGALTVVNDALGALRAGSDRGDGVAVVVGTGAATGARGPRGTWHASWWQEPQGAMDLAEQTLRSVYRAHLGIDPPTALTETVLNIYGMATVEDVLHLRTHRTELAPDRRGMVARALIVCAAGGDRAATRIVRAQGTALGEYAAAAARQVGFEREDRFPLALAGGVFRGAGQELGDAVAARVEQEFPRVCPSRSKLEPVAGALMLAFECHGLPIDPTRRGHIVATLPADGFYAT
jgi:N-acetylglucosamine kinase-like BadF-type ATPase